MLSLAVRPLVMADAPACVALINHIIAQGGSTAHDHPFDVAGFQAEYIAAPVVKNAVLSGDRLVGFQVCLDDGPGLYSIGTFTDRRDPVPGAGRALFARTLADCRARGGVAILAKITADNTGGLAFYSRLGFADWDIRRGDHTRPSGKVVDRIVKRFVL